MQINSAWDILFAELVTRTQQPRYKHIIARKVFYFMESFILWNSYHI